MKKFNLSFLFVIILFACSESENESFLQINFVSDLDYMKSQGLIETFVIHNQEVTITFTDYHRLTYNLSDLKNIRVYDREGLKLLETSFLKEGDNYLLGELKSFENSLATPNLENPDHEGETFCECFKNDQEYMCDGFVGCVATLSPLVQLTLAAHCLDETKGKKCKDDEKEDKDN